LSDPEVLEYIVILVATNSANLGSRVQHKRVVDIGSDDKYLMLGEGVSDLLADKLTFTL
jgi:hypothetical protein